MGIQREVNQRSEEFPSQALAEAYRAARAATDPGGTWFVFETENGKWAVARADVEPATPPTGELTAEKPRPEPGDPRSGLSRDVPGWGGP